MTHFWYNFYKYPVSFFFSDVSKIVIEMLYLAMLKNPAKSSQIRMQSRPRPEM